MAADLVLSASLFAKSDIAGALKLTAKGGRCVLAGMASQTTRSVKFGMEDFVMMNKTLCGNVFDSCNPRPEIPVFARLSKSGRPQLDEMITWRYGLDHIDEAYQNLHDGQILQGIIEYSD